MTQQGNSPATDRGDRSLQAWFEDQARRTPQSPAVTLDGQSLSYHELNARANRLAHRLMGDGVGLESRVGLCLERSIELIVGILGILKAGAAYVPLDPAYPQDRLDFMVKDAGIQIVVGEERVLECLGGSGLRKVFLPLAGSPGDLEAFENPAAGVAPSNAAYVIYTSGSTGQPKGCVVTHWNVIRLFRCTEGLFDFGPGDVWTLFHSFAFDFSVWEIWGALLYGGRLVVVPYTVSRSPREFWDLLIDQGVTVLNQTPTAFRILMECETLVGIKAARSRLRYVVFGGEALNPRDLRLWFSRHGYESPSLINMYGITETTVHVTYLRLTPEHVQRGGSPVGRPLPDLRVYLMDERGEPVPAGVPGEIYVGGAGVARGYLNRPELTASRFVPSPGPQYGEGPLYRSGDLAVLTPDGNLEFQGRIDHQVKIRGHRIELGEIESAMAEMPEIASCIVIPKTFSPDDTRLVAYFIACGPLEPSRALIQQHLRRTLPEYMVPSAFVKLEKLPLTVNGKLDRAALPPPQASNSQVDAGFIAPKTPVEKTIASIWRELLGVKSIGVNDNFLSLGGHSLLASRSLVRISAAFNVDVPLRVLFQAPTVAALAREIAKMPVNHESRSSPIPRQPDGPSPLSFAQQRLWFIQQLEGSRFAAYHITRVTRLEGALDAGSLRQAFGDLVQRHQPLRTVIRVEDSQPVQVVNAPSPFDLPVVELAEADLKSRDSRLQAIVREQAERLFDLTTDLMLRGMLVKTGDSEHFLIVTFHHIAADGWSMDVFWRELPHFYESRLHGKPPSLPKLPIRYVDYSVWQRAALTADRTASSLNYWRKKLDGLAPLELPTDRPRPLEFSYRAQPVVFRIRKQHADPLKSLCRQTGATLHMALLTVFQAMISKYTKREDFSVGVPTASRDRTELEGMIGFFVNTLVIRADLAGDPGFCELLERTRTASLEAHEHQDLPFDRLVAELRPGRSGGRSPLVNVYFQLLDIARPSFERSGLVASVLPEPGLRVRFDLELQIQPVEDDLEGTLLFATDLFNRDTIERMARHYCSLFESAIAHPHKPISQLSMMDEADRQRIESMGRLSAPSSGERSVADQSRRPQVDAGGAALKAGSSLIAMNQPADGLEKARPFFCFPGGSGHGGQVFGDGMSFAPLAHLLGPDILFYCVAPRELSTETIAQLVPRIARETILEIKAVAPGPYQLGGYSLGGLVAMEVARLLIKDGESVSCLALLDAFGPDFPRRRNFVEWVKVKAANLKAQPLTPKLRRIGGSFNAVPGPVGDSPVSPTDALFSSYKEYVRGLAAYPGRITLFRAAVQPPGSRMSHDDMTNGWGSVARDGVEVILVPGTHLSMFEPPNLQAFADALQNRLRRPHQ